MFESLSPAEFYRATFVANGQANLLPERSFDYEKHAEAFQTTPDVIALAQKFFEQMVLDGLPQKVAEPKELMLDAVKMAQTYFDQMGEMFEKTGSFVTGLTEALAKEAAKFAEAQGVTLDGYELVKVAGLQVMSAEEQMEGVKVSSVNDIVNALQGSVHAPNVAGAGAMHPGNAARALLQHAAGVDVTNMPDNEAVAHVNRMWGSNPAASPGEQATFTTGLAANLMTSGQAMQSQQPIVAGQTHAGTLLQQALQPAAAPGMFSTPLAKGIGIAGLGAAGLGALYMMHRRRRQEAEQQAAQAEQERRFSRREVA
jgi:hypothetical protein